MECPSCRAANEDDAAECFTCGSTLAGTRPVKQGDTIAGRYVVKARLGRGGMGTVYRAHDTALEEDVALKVMAPGSDLDPDLARRFRSEIRLARKIAHRNVCRIYEYGEDAGRRFISMELIDGTDVRRLLRERGALASAEAYDIAVQVARGLEAIHEAGIIHRDLKTPNIMRDPEGRVKVMDFGIAKRFERDGSSTGLTGTGHVVGTPDYMSPEQARAEKLDFRSDVYALGVVIFELFTAELPFRADTPMAVLLKHLHEPPPIDGPAGARLPAAIRPVLRRALAKAPADRHASMTDLLADLERARAADPAASAPVASRPPVILGAAVPATEAIPELEPSTTAPARRAPTPVEVTATNVSLTDPGARARSISTVEEPLPGGPPSPAPRPWLKAGLALAIVGILAAVVVFTRARPAPPAPAAQNAVVAAPVVVSLNALPWARVRLAAAPGQTEEVPTLSGDENVTPLTVLLAPGDYDVEMDNGGITAARRERLQVRAGQPNAFVFVMPGYDPDAAAEVAR
jgi:serine/threonine protein kinase